MERCVRVELVSEAGFQFKMSPTSLQYILMTTSRRLLAAVVEGGHGEGVIPSLCMEEFFGG